MSPGLGVGGFHAPPPPPLTHLSLLIFLFKASLFKTQLKCHLFWESFPPHLPPLLPMHPQNTPMRALTTPCVLCEWRGASSLLDWEPLGEQECMSHSSWGRTEKPTCARYLLACPGPRTDGWMDAGQHRWATRLSHTEPAPAAGLINMMDS